MPERPDIPARDIAAAWRRILDARESRERWERHAENAETEFADLATHHGLVWTEAVEIATEWEKAHA